jgi:hypothetical protein
MGFLLPPEISITVTGAPVKKGKKEERESSLERVSKGVDRRTSLRYL